MENNFKVNMNEYLPLRDVVFNTLRQAILKGEHRSVKPFVNWNWKVLYL